MRLVVGFVAFLVGVGSLVSEARSEATATAQAPSSRTFAPVADHHVHLLSPAAASLLTPPLLPEVRLPTQLDALLKERNRRWRDQAGLADLYTQDAIYSKGGSAGWVQGREAVAGYIRWTVSDTPYVIKPVASRPKFPPTSPATSSRTTVPTAISGCS